MQKVADARGHLDRKAGKIAKSALREGRAKEKRGQYRRHPTISSSSRGTAAIPWRPGWEKE